MKALYEKFVKNCQVFEKNEKGDIELKQGSLEKANELIEECENYFCEVGEDVPYKIQGYDDKENIMDCYHKFIMMNKNFSMRLYLMNNGNPFAK